MVLKRARGHNTTELCGATTEVPLTENKTHHVPLTFYALKVKEGRQKTGRTDDNDGKVVVRGQPVVTVTLGTPPELTCTGDAVPLRQPA